MKLQSILTIAGLFTSALSAHSALGASDTLGKIYAAGTWHSSQIRQAPTPLTGFAALRGPLDLQSLAREFFVDNAATLRLDVSTAMIETAVQRGAELETRRFRKSWKGLEVLGGETVLQLRDGKVAFANADITPLTGVSSQPRISADEAQRMAFSSYRGKAYRAQSPSLKVLLLGASNDREARLVYSIPVLDSDQLSSDVHYIDANTGSELLVTSNVHTLANRRVLVGQGSEDDFDIVTDDNAAKIDQTFKAVYSDQGCSSAPSPASGDSWSMNPFRRLLAGEAEISAAVSPTPCQSVSPTVNASALAAYTNSGLVYDYYNDVHRRNSVDGKGLPMRSVVNFGGDSFKNAAWFNDRQIMLYGNGGSDGRFNDFASPLDVVAHEITHGVTSTTAALQYASESGALNESYSDLFGKLVAFRNGKVGDWKVGRELFRDGTGFIRDLENPTVGHNRDFKFRGQTCHRFNDYCGVHDNSGIPSKAAVMIAKKLGLERTGRLYFLTLTQLLRSGSDFREARAQTEAACATLFGAGHPDCKVVSDAFESVGI